MHINDSMLHLWCSILKSFEVSNLEKLLAHFGGAKELFNCDLKELSNITTDYEYDCIIKTRSIDYITNILNLTHRNSAKYICRNHSLYPYNLRCIEDNPYGLFVKGHLPDENSINLAIIGSRKCSIYGREMAFYFAKELAKHGIGIVSGLAAGIDGSAHRGAIEGGGCTYGILGGGIDSVYPRENYDIYNCITDKGGIISEYAPGFKPKGRWFPVRNRIISGLCQGIVVIEAKEKSGSLITVDAGLEQGKDIFALPGRCTDDNSKGCNNLIKQGGMLVTEPKDILEYYNISDKLYNKTKKDKNIMKIKEIENFLAPQEKIVYSCVSLEPIHVDDIVGKVDLSVKEVLNILYELEHRDIIKQVVNGYYIIVV